MPNRLAKEVSPYLRQHADNPVDWYPWGDEALSRAQAEDKPILVSIGYSACHWCHVMAHESFESPDIARLMNELFVNIKVDREARPDLDSLYMEAVQAMTGRGGWPLTVFLTPDGKPFFGGTYFPPEDRAGLPAFPRVLKTVADAYQHRKGEIESTFRELLSALSRQREISQKAGGLETGILDEAFSNLKLVFDERSGGFGTAPKFPQPLVLEFLLQHYHRTGDDKARSMVELSLDSMARGGIYDQLGGGFHRYATDSTWLVPHFEKMLYDNALLGQVYTHAYLISGRRSFRSVAEGTLDYVLREMTAPQGCFCSSQDADSEGVEGKYYTWTPGEITEVIGGRNAEIVSGYYGVTAGGNFEGRNVLHTGAEALEEHQSIITEARRALLKRREQRIRPERDEKIIASWNGLMLATLSEAACVFERDDYLHAAEANGSFLLNSMISDNHLEHIYKDGSKIEGFLEDYAMVILGLLALHQATFGSRWLETAARLCEVMVSTFWDNENSTFYDSALLAGNLFLRPMSIVDSVIPSGSSAATAVLLRLSRLTNNSRFEDIASRCLGKMGESLAQYPLGFGAWLCALDFYLSRPKEIAIIGPRNNPATQELLRTLCKTWLPNKVFAAYDPRDKRASGIKLLEDKAMTNGRPTAYLCERFMCQEPATDPNLFQQQLLGKSIGRSFPFDANA